MSKILYENQDRDIAQKTLEYRNYIRSQLEEPYEEILGLLRDELEEDELAKLYDYFHYYFSVQHKRESSVSIEKMKAVILLLHTYVDDHDTKKILSYLEGTKFGWCGEEYVLNNRCLRRRFYASFNHCKRLIPTSDVEQAVDLFNVLSRIFFDPEYGAIVLYIFSYCIAGAFRGRLERDGFPVPFYLQIACERDSILYKLIHEIVEICDVNSGLIEFCNENTQNYAYCNYTLPIFYPTQMVSKDLNDLSNIQDSVTIIDGNENDRYYNMLLREISNYHIRKKSLDEIERFNSLPLFVCPLIKSSFNNVFNMPLSELDVSVEYLYLIREHKRTLASWVAELVKSYSKHLFPTRDISNREERHPFYQNLRNSINRVSHKHPDMTLDNIKNVGFLEFFFRGFLSVFLGTFSFQEDTQFKWIEVKGKNNLLTGRRNIDLFSNGVDSLLSNLHRRYLPAPTTTGVKDRTANQMARQIEKQYRLFKVYIRLTLVENHEDRFVFNVDTLQETRDEDISKNIATVQRRLKKYEYFRVDLTNPRAIRLIVAEKQLTDSNLLKIFQHKDYIESNMKIPYAIGYDDTGKVCVRDLFEFPHLLLAGTTRSGKSTAMMCLLMSIAYKHRTGNVNVLLIDLIEKDISDFSKINDQPMMSHAIITDVDKACYAILELDEERSRRLKDSKRLKEIPYIVCVIDEFPKLFTDLDNATIDKKEVELAITRLLSGGRHAKIHLVLAVQDPIKKHMVCGIGNIPAKIALRCNHYTKSVVILGRKGADKLIGKGQMIFDSPTDEDKRLQGAFLSDENISKLLQQIKNEFKQENKYPFVLTEESLENHKKPSDSGPDKKKQFEWEKLATDVIISTLAKDEVSSLYFEKVLNIGYRKLLPILEFMEIHNIVSEKHGNRPRKVLPKHIEDIPQEVIGFLERYGHTRDSVITVLNSRTRTIVTEE